MDIICQAFALYLSGLDASSISAITGEGKTKIDFDLCLAKLRFCEFSDELVTEWEDSWYCTPIDEATVKAATHRLLHYGE